MSDDNALPRPTDSPGPTAWNWVGWLAYGVLIIAVFMLSGFWSIIVVGFGGSTCGDTPSTSEARSGQHHLLLTLGLALLPWALAGLLDRRHWLRYLLAALIAASPPLIMLLTHLQVADWRGGFCF